MSALPQVLPSEITDMLPDHLHETANSFMIQVLLDLRNHPDMETIGQVASVNSPATFRDYMMPIIESAIVDRFMRNDKMLRNLRDDKDLRDAMFERARGGERKKTT